jgi:hypothetical protein
MKDINKVKKQNGTKPAPSLVDNGISLQTQFNTPAHSIKNRLGAGIDKEEELNFTLSQKQKYPREQTEEPKMVEKFDEPNKLLEKGINRFKKNRDSRRELVMKMVRESTIKS